MKSGSLRNCWNRSLNNRAMSLSNKNYRQTISGECLDSIGDRNKSSNRSGHFFAVNHQKTVGTHGMGPPRHLESTSRFNSCKLVLARINVIAVVIVVIVVAKVATVTASLVARVKSWSHYLTIHKGRIWTLLRLGYHPIMSARIVLVDEKDPIVR